VSARSAAASGKIVIEQFRALECDANRSAGPVDADAARAAMRAAADNRARG